MPEQVDLDRILTEINALRQELGEVQKAQAELGRAMEQMTSTFRAIATHLGIAAEPYRTRSASRREEGPPGFA
jgi:prefoldin subunit 5